MLGFYSLEKIFQSNHNNPLLPLVNLILTNCTINGIRGHNSKLHSCEALFPK